MSSPMCAAIGCSNPVGKSVFCDKPHMAALKKIDKKIHAVVARAGLNTREMKSPVLEDCRTARTKLAIKDGYLAPTSPTPKITHTKDAGREYV